MCVQFSLLQNCPLTDWTGSLQSVNGTLTALVMFMQLVGWVGTVGLTWQTWAYPQSLITTLKNVHLFLEEARILHAAAFITLSRLPVMLHLALWLKLTSQDVGVEFSEGATSSEHVWLWNGKLQWLEVIFPKWSCGVGEVWGLHSCRRLSQWWRLLAFVFLTWAHKG